MYCVFGEPIEHSLSTKLIETTLNIRTSKLSLDSSITKNQFIELLRKNNIKFGNVTYPYKKLIYDFSDLTIFPSIILKSINTFVFDGNKIISTNTDGEGFFISLLLYHKKIYNFLLNNRNFLIAGSGATANSIAFSAKFRGIKTFYISRRSKIDQSNFNLNNLNINPIFISYKSAINFIKKEKPIIMSTLPFSVLSIIDKDINLISTKEKLEIDQDIKDFFHIAKSLNIPIFDANYKDYIEIQKQYKSLVLPENLFYGIEQLIGQGLLSVYFFSKKNFLDENKFYSIKNRLLQTNIF